MQHYVHLDRGLQLSEGSILPRYFCRSPLIYMAKASMMLVSCSDLSWRYRTFSGEILLGCEWDFTLFWISRNFVRDQLLIKGWVLDTWTFRCAEGMNPGDSDIYCTLQMPQYLTRVQETPSLVACFVVQTSTSVVERTPRGKFLSAACCMLLRVMLWTPKPKEGSVSFAVGLGFFCQRPPDLLLKALETKE